MIKNITKTGWDEVTVVHVNITHMSEKVFSTASGWVESMKKHPSLDKEGRNHCQLCNKKWIDLMPETKTYLIFTDKGNKILCEECIKNFK
jgi:hypothetical protein